MHEAAPLLLKSMIVKSVPAPAPPLATEMRRSELAQAAADGRSDIGLDEVGHLIAHRFAEVISGEKRRRTTVTTQDRRRAVETALWLDAQSHREIGLEDAA